VCATMLDSVAAELDRGDVETARVDASAAKILTATSAVRTCELAIQAHGAIGFTKEAGLDVLLRRAVHTSSLLGDAEWHRQWLAFHHDAIAL